MDKIKQNKNYCVVYKSLSILVCVMMLFTFMFFGAYADNDAPESSNDYSEPLDIASLDYNRLITSSILPECTLYAQRGDGTVYKYAYTDVICKAVSYKSVNSVVSHMVFACDDASFNLYYAFTDVNGELTNSYKKNDAGYNTTYDLYYTELTTTTDDVLMPEYSTLNEALQALRNAFDYHIETGYEFSYSLPAGNVLVLDVTNLNPTIDLSMSTPTLEYQVTSTQYYGMISEIPNPVSLPISGTTPINWTAYGKKDPFGRASHWTASETVSGMTSGHNHAYFVIANPFSNNYSSANGSELVANPNTTITIHVTNCNYGKIFQLNESFNAGTFNNTQAGDTMSVNYNSDTGTWDTINDTTGEADAPVYGGNNQGETAINSVSDWLENISNKISSFFTGPINAIGTLVGAGSNFFRTLSGLYSWLPSPVLSVLTSALIVVITVGVIKVFI